SSRRRHTRFSRDWSSDVCSSDLSDCKQKSIPFIFSALDPTSNVAGMRLQPPARTPIAAALSLALATLAAASAVAQPTPSEPAAQIGRASCRERVWISALAGALQQ